MPLKHEWGMVNTGTVTEMKMTLDIPGCLYGRLKNRAASEGCSMRDLIQRGVERVLRDGPRTKRRGVKLPMLRSKQPGSLALDNEKIFKIIPFP